MIDPFFMKGGFVLEGRDPFVLPEHFHIVFSSWKPQEYAASLMLISLP